MNSLFKTQTGAAAAFNIFNAETVDAVIRAAIKQNRATYIQVSASTVIHFGVAATAKMIESYIPKSNRDLFRIHLDHCLDITLIKQCIESGWDSVMIDASMKPINENIEITKTVVNIAHANGVLVEGELGAVGGAEDGFDSYGSEEAMVELLEVKRYVEETGVDLLAVGIGNRHGHYAEAKADAPLDIGKLEEVYDIVGGLPLVLHGGTGVPEQQIRGAIKNGVKKINISTELKEGFFEGFQKHFNENKLHSIDKYLAAQRNLMEGLVVEKLNQFK